METYFLSVEIKEGSNIYVKYATIEHGSEFVYREHERVFISPLRSGSPEEQFLFINFENAAEKQVYKASYTIKQQAINTMIRRNKQAMINHSNFERFTVIEYLLSNEYRLSCVISQIRQALSNNTLIRYVSIKKTDHDLMYDIKSYIDRHYTNRLKTTIERTTDDILIRFERIATNEV